jgi:hypothetical protein
MDNDIAPPLITVADLVGGRQQVNQITLLTERHGITLRFRLRIDSCIEQYLFVVEAFARDQVIWNVLWSIPPETYKFVPSPDTPGVTDPTTNLIASPHSLRADIKVASWQKIIDELTNRADQLLR